MLIPGVESREGSQRTSIAVPVRPRVDRSICFVEIHLSRKTIPVFIGRGDNRERQTKSVIPKVDPVVLQDVGGGCVHAIAPQPIEEPDIAPLGGHGLLQ